MRLAIIADWLTVFGGAEHVLQEFRTLWPDAPILTTVVRRGSLGPLDRASIRTTRLQALYRAIGRHQLLLPLMPRAVEEIDLQGFDVILSSSHAVAKGVIPPPSSVHICYCHTPMRYAWEMEEKYLEDFRVPQVLRGPARRTLKRLRRWDLATAKRVDAFIANSSETRDRIARIYGRDALVIHPPADDRFFTSLLLPPERRSPFLAVGRLVPYKRFDLAIEVCNRLRLPLLIAGQGREEAGLRRMAGPTVRFLGHVPDSDLPSLYGSARAVLSPAHEDAGIIMIEAQACGTPVIALGKGGALDTIEEGTTGTFFREQSGESLRDAIHHFERMHLDPNRIREHARQFSTTIFRERIRDAVRGARLE